jgi:hypothetical protein
MFWGVFAAGLHGVAGFTQHLTIRNRVAAVEKIADDMIVFRAVTRPDLLAA